MSARSRHWKRFDEPELDVVWAGTMQLDIAKKLTFLRELATEVAAAGIKRGSEYDKVRAGVVSLHDAANLLGRSPSQYEYRLLRRNFPSLDLVPDGTLRRWLGNGTWNDCLRRALLDTVSDGDFATVVEGDRFTEQELVDAVRMYMGDHDGRVPILAHLMAWARSPDTQARPGRRPLSYGPFHRLGGYREVLVRNGIVGANETRFDVRGRALPMKWRFTDEELRDAVLGVKRELGRVPRETDYRRARERARENNTGVLPSVSALTGRFGGSWSSVLEAVGLPPLTDEVRPRPRAAGRRKASYSRDELMEAVKHAWTETGEPFSKPAYTRWRAATLTNATKAGALLHIPHVETICKVFGGWPEAVEQALPPEVRKRRRRKTYDDESV